MSIPMENHNDVEREEAHPAQKVENSNIIDLMRNVTNFASLLRVCGAIIMLLAMSTYLLQGWSDGNDISRYYMLLSQTFLLSVGGFGLSYLLKENKGARIFFGLSLICITANMTTLGALIFSTAQWGSELAQYPGFAQWVAPDSGAILMAFLTTVALCMPIAWLAHQVLARRSARMISALFLFTNLLLLLPVRESLYVGIIALIAVVLPLALLSRRLSQDNTLRTPEGLFAMTTVFIPAGLIICRSIWLYPVDEILQIILASTAFIALRFCAQQTEEESFARGITYWLSLGAVLGVALPAAALTDRFLADALAFNVFGLVFAGLLVDISTRCRKPFASIRLATIVLAVSHICPVMFTDDMFSALLCIVAGLMIIAMGRQHGLRYVMAMGLLTLLAGMGRQILELAGWLDFSNWITLSISGGVIIIVASLIERHGAVIKMKWDRLAQPIEKERS